jgi:hypothetical protein
MPDVNRKADNDFDRMPALAHFAAMTQEQVHQLKNFVSHIDK